MSKPLDFVLQFPTIPSSNSKNYNGHEIVVVIHREHGVFLSFLSPARVISILKGHGQRFVHHIVPTYFTNAESAADHWS